MPKDYDRDKVLDVPCSHCGVTTGEPCISRSGRVASDEHTRRKGAVYPKYLKGAGGQGKKPGVPSLNIHFANLSGAQQIVLSTCRVMKIGSIGMRFEGTVVAEWKPTVECIEMGLVEIFIGEDLGADRKGEACARLRLTNQGLDVWNRAIRGGTE